MDVYIVQDDLGNVIGAFYAEAEAQEKASDYSLASVISQTVEGSLPTVTVFSDGVNPGIEVSPPIVRVLLAVGEDQEVVADSKHPGEAPCGECCDEPILGVLTRMNSDEGIQRCDGCGRFAGDLEAAYALAQHLGHGATVRYLGRDDVERMFRTNDPVVLIKEDTDPWIVFPDGAIYEGR